MTGELRELVVCSLEAWDEVWRRNQFLVDELLRGNRDLRVLFVEPPADPTFELLSGRRPSLPRYGRVGRNRRLLRFRPLKPLPRKVGPIVDRSLRLQVRVVARAAGFRQPVLWVNDVTYAPLIEQTGWPSLYDVTDDWLLAPLPSRELERLGRLDELALALADEVVVCSHALGTTRGRVRAVSLIPNGVDVDHFRQPQPRPDDLPSAPTAVYVGTLHEARLDVDLVVEVARGIRGLHVVLVGPDSLAAESRERLRAADVLLLGPRPYDDVPAYLQHADAIIVPHLVTPFTESLDPIKAYECLAVATPTVATPVAGFRHLNGMAIADRASFIETLRAVLSGTEPEPTAREPEQWAVRANEFRAVLLRARGRRTAGVVP